MKETTEEIYNEMILLLEKIKSAKKMTDFSFDSRFVYSYLLALVNKNIRIDKGVERVRRGNIGTNKLIIKSAKRFIAKNNL